MGGALNFSKLKSFIPKKALSQIFPSLFPQAASSVGLDWNEGELRIVEVQKKPSGLELVHASLAPLEEDRAASVKKAFESQRISAASVRVAVSGEGIVVRYIVLPRMNKEQIAQAISFDLEKHIPYKANEVIVDHQFLEETPEKKMRVLLVAVRKNLVGSLIDFFKQMNLVPALIDVAGFAIANAFLFNKIHPQIQEAVGVIHVGEELTHVCIVRNELSYFARDIGLGRQQLESDPAFLTDLANEVRLSLDYYESQNNDTVKAAYISGTLAPDQTEPLQKIVGLAISEWDPTKVLAISNEISKEELEKIKPSLHLVLGLALRPL